MWLWQEGCVLLSLRWRFMGDWTLQEIDNLIQEPLAPVQSFKHFGEAVCVTELPSHLLLVSCLKIKEWAALSGFWFGVFCPNNPYPFNCCIGILLFTNPKCWKKNHRAWTVTPLGARQSCPGEGILDMCSTEAFRKSFCSTHYLWEEQPFISRAVSSVLFKIMNNDKHVGGKPLNRSN